MLRLRRRRHPRRLHALDAAFGDYPHAIHYALKANSTLEIVRLLKALGSSVDANSMGEVDVALRCGFHPGQIMFTGVGKSADELARAIALGLKAINVESPGELDRLDRLAQEQQTDRRASRCASTRTSTRRATRTSPPGSRRNKFGVPIDAAPEIFREIQRRAGLDPVGVHSHIGSQITSARSAAARRPRRRRPGACRCVAEGVPLRHVDFGGGVGISYDGTPAIDPAEYARALVEHRPAERADRAHRAGPRARRARRERSSHASSTSSTSRARATSSCSTPA